MPYVTDGSRLYRSFALDTSKLDREKKPYEVEGYATTFDEPYDMGGYTEVIDRNVLVGADVSDVIFQLNHEGTVMARMSNGSLDVTPDDKGLHVRAYLGGSASGRDLYEEIANGLVTKMSWGFTVDEQDLEYDQDKNEVRIKRVKKVFDVSAVSIPANGGTEIHARSLINGVIDKAQEEFLKRKQMEARQRMAAALRIR